MTGEGASTLPPEPLQTVRELRRCFNFRYGPDGVHRWEFDTSNQSLAVVVEGPLIVDAAKIMIRAAIDGVGLAFMLEEQ